MELEDLVEKIKLEVEELKPELESLKEELKAKETELKKIIKANEREEARLKEKREKVVGEVRKSDYNNYTRIRKAKGGIAIVIINRSACSGCYLPGVPAPVPARPHAASQPNPVPAF